MLKDEDSWFLAGGSWNVQLSMNTHCEPDLLDGADLKQYVKDVQDWLQQWVSESHNPFIHRQLYRLGIPRCIQDAFTALAAYLSRNAANEDMTFRIIEERVQQLLQEHRAGAALDTSEQLAHVQAFLVYQTIQLFDGNVACAPRRSSASRCCSTGSSTSGRTLTWTCATRATASSSRAPTRWDRLGVAELAAVDRGREHPAHLP